MTMLARRLLLLFTILQYTALCLSAAAQPTEKIKLTVLLYPWVPDYEHISNAMEVEKENPAVDLVISDQDWIIITSQAVSAPYTTFTDSTAFSFRIVSRLDDYNP